MGLVFEHLPADAGSSGPTLVLLHGLGADEHDLLALGFALPRRCEVITPRAPFTLPGGGYSWFHIGEDGSVDHQALTDSLSALRGLIEEIRPGRRGPMILGGFSQGAAMAASLVLTGTPADSALLSGFIPNTLAPLPSGALRGRRVFIAHGQDDLLIPVLAATAARTEWERLGATVDMHIHAGGHQITDGVMTALENWLEQSL